MFESGDFARLGPQATFTSIVDLLARIELDSLRPEKLPQSHTNPIAGTICVRKAPIPSVNTISTTKKTIQAVLEAGSCLGADLAGGLSVRTAAGVVEVIVSTLVLISLAC